MSAHEGESTIVLTPRESLRLLELLDSPPPRKYKYLQAMNRYLRMKGMIFLPLSSQHAQQDFDCGNEDLNRWLAKVAMQRKDRSVSSTFVTVSDDVRPEILGFYELSVAKLANVDLPARYRDHLPVKLPVLRVGKLAVSTRHQGRRIGESLLFDAIDRIARISQEVGGAGIVVNATPSTIDFFKQYGFEQMADHPHILFLPIDHLRLNDVGNIPCLLDKPKC